MLAWDQLKRPALPVEFKKSLTIGRKRPPTSKRLIWWILYNPGDSYKLLITYSPRLSFLLRLAWYFSMGKLYLLLEYCPHGDMKTFLGKNRRNFSLSPTTIPGRCPWPWTCCAVCSVEILRFIGILSRFSFDFCLLFS